jgi:TrmH family RNA methyltransferase
MQLAPPVSPSFILIVDAVHDPGNLGTIIRLAAGAAVPVVMLMPGTVDLYNPKVVRSAMGASFSLPVLAASWAEVKGWRTSHHIFLADSSDGTPHFLADWKQPCALIVSDEAHGPGPEALQLAEERVTIPMPGRTESLNVAMAAGILIYEMLRQRAEAGLNPGAQA